MIKSVAHNLTELLQVLEGLSDELYNRSSYYLFESSIGQHVRHILEMYDVMLKGYDIGTFSFEKRERNMAIEKSVAAARLMILGLIEEIEKQDKEIFCLVVTEEGEESLKTTYYRELLYCFEHGIHHQALIKVALKEFKRDDIPQNFGVAPSTIRYRLSCVQ